MAQIFPLKQGMIIPVRFNSKKESLMSNVFPKETVSISFIERGRNHIAQSVTLDLILVDSLNPVDTIQTIGSKTFPKDGIPHPGGLLSNQAEYNIYILAKKELDENILVLQNSVREKEMDLANVQTDEARRDINTDLSSLRETLQQFYTDRNSLLVVQPVPMLIYSYMEVINLFDERGELTEEGVAWGKTLPLNDLTVGDYVGEAITTSP